MYGCRQRPSMTKSARFVQGRLPFLDGGQVVMQDIKNQRSAKHVLS